MRKYINLIIGFAGLILFIAVVISIWIGLGYLAGLLIHSFIPSFNPAWAIIVFLLAVLIKK